MEGTAMPKFTIKDLDLYYGDFKALNKINMEIPQKQIVAFIGPSGCGIWPGNGRVIHHRR